MPTALLLAGVLHTGVFFGLYPVAGAGISAAALFIVVPGAIAYGLMGGVAFSGLAALLNALLIFAVYHYDSPSAIPATITGTLTLCLTGVAFGLLSNFVGRLNREITKRQAAEARLEHQANHDSLTGLPNRRAFTAQASRHVQHATSARPVAVFFLDLDRFKVINDTLGHDAGDDLLRQVAGRLGRTVRSGDLLARLGGDEFAILTTDLPRDTGIPTLSARLHAAFDTPFELHGAPRTIRPSVGVAVSPHDGVTLEALLSHADIAMYQAKRARTHTPGAAPTRTTLQLELDVEQALATEAFIPHYQVIIDSRTNTPLGFEALARWTDAAGGARPAASFIPAIEAAGLTSRLDQLILRRVLADAPVWRAHLPPGGWVSVNASAATLNEPHFARTVLDALTAAGVAPSELLIELTERTALEPGSVATRTIQELRGHGVRVALDDFGVGYASLSQLRDLEVDVVKLDRSFTHGVALDTRAGTFLTAVLKLLDDIGCVTIVEGVESSEQARWLRARPCHAMQGYLFGRPQELAASILDPEARP